MGTREMRIEVIDDATAAQFRRLSPAQRIEAANVLMIQMGEMLERELARRYPEWGTEKLRSEWRRRMCGRSE